MGEGGEVKKKEEGVGKGLVLLNLISSYVNSAHELFLESKDVSDLCKINSYQWVVNSM